MKKTAKLIKDNLPDFIGHAALYQVDPPMEGVELKSNSKREFNYVVVSTAHTFGLETYIFGADETGDVFNWLELDGSMKGTSSHKKVLKNAGYELIR